MYARTPGERNESERPRRRAPAILRALSHRNYQLFLAGQMVSLIGTWMQSVAQSWLVYRLTGSALLLGAIGFAGQIPVLLLAPAGGAVADRRRRHRIVIATQIASMVLAFTLAAATLLGVIEVSYLFVLSAALGAVNAFDMPARQALVVDLVGREDLANAIALNSSMVNGARVVGPALAGVLVGAIGEGWCFFANGVSFLAVIGGLLAMRMPDDRPAPVEGSAIDRILEGFRFVLGARSVRALLLLLGLMSLGAMPYTVLMPVFAERVLGGGPTALGALMGASGAGALLGAIALAARGGVRGLGRWVAVAAILTSAGLVAFGVSRSFAISAALLVLVGMAFMIALAGANTLLQAMVPDALRGRVMSVYAMMFLGMAPFGALLAGALASMIGAPSTVIAGGAACLAGAVAFALKLPALRPDARALLAAREREAR